MLLPNIIPRVKKIVDNIVRDDAGAIRNWWIHYIPITVVYCMEESLGGVKGKCEENCLV